MLTLLGGSRVVFGILFGIARLFGVFLWLRRFICLFRIFFIRFASVVGFIETASLKHDC